MNILDYDIRVQLLDTWMNYFSHNILTKFNILIFIHYIVLFFLMYYVLFFSKNIYFFIVSYILLIIQITINLYDDGCFIMKLERKYIGKWWYGPYTIFNFIHPKLINNISCSILYKMLSVFAFSYASYRFINEPNFMKDIHYPYLDF
jgi:hypothetical protein